METIFFVTIAEYPICQNTGENDLDGIVAEWGVIRFGLKGNKG
jgi:hypothetical protein